MRSREQSRTLSRKEIDDYERRHLIPARMLTLWDLETLDALYLESNPAPLDLEDPAWRAYFAGVDATFTQGESRVRRLPRSRRANALRVQPM